MERVRTCALFGGTGFIGTHIALHMLREGLAQQIVLVDLRSPSAEAYAKPLHAGMRAGEVFFHQWDVRQGVPTDLPGDPPDLVIDCVGTYRVLGSPPSSHFFTYVRAAQNICNPVDAWGCRRIVVSRGIPPCSDGSERDLHRSGLESRALAEEAASRLYRRWQAQSPDRTLLEVRLGEVYGPGDRGEIAQLVRRTVHGRFWCGRGMAMQIPSLYAKELGSILQCGIEQQAGGGDPVSVMSAWIDPPPTLEDHIAAIRRVAGLGRPLWRVPAPAAACLAQSTRILSRVRGQEMTIGPESWSRQIDWTNGTSNGLRRLNYSWKYSLEEAFEDWQRDQPELFAGAHPVHRPIPLRIVPESSPSEQSVT